MTDRRCAARSAVAGVYAITPDDDDSDRLVAMVGAALAGGVRVVQYRHKSADDRLRRGQTARLAATCRDHGALLIVNDHADVALALDGVGLHVGDEDADDLPALRRRLGSRVLGVSCYGDLERARHAVAAGADYVAFGSVFASPTKPAARPAPLALFAPAHDVGVPRVAIGGITEANLPTLVAAGVDAAAIISDLFGDSEPAVVRAKARRLTRLFATTPRSETR